MYRMFCSTKSARDGLLARFWHSYLRPCGAMPRVLEVAMVIVVVAGLEGCHLVGGYFLNKLGVSSIEAYMRAYKLYLGL